MSAASSIRYKSELMLVKKQENGHCVFIFSFSIIGGRGKNNLTIFVTFIHFACNALVLGA